MTTAAVTGVLTADQRRVMARVLAEESSRREHVVVYLSGAHAYGFPSPDSDLDLKAIHVASTEALLDFEPPAATVDRAEVIESVEIDFTSNELAHALSGILAGNGNFLERVLGRMTAVSSPLHDAPRPIAQRALSKRVHRHYRGFAQNQLRILEKEPTAKKLLYVLRTSTTGIHLLETGELEADLTRSMKRYDLADAVSLVERKRAGERVAIDASLLEVWRPRIDGLFARLDRACASSVLPDEPPNEREVRDFLLSARRARWCRIMKLARTVTAIVMSSCGAAKPTTVAIEPLPTASASSAVPAKPPPTVAAFLDAGCKATSPGVLDCKEARIPGIDACVMGLHVLHLTFDPPAIVAECFMSQQSQTKGVRQTGCMRAMSVRLIAATSDGFRNIDSAVELAKTFGPVTSPDEAIAFAVALTGSEVVMRSDPDATQLGVTQSRADGDDFRVRLFSTPRCGCSHPTFGIDYDVTRDGVVSELARVQVWEDPRLRGLCVD